MAYNSRIQAKIGKCIDCREDAPQKPLTAGRCILHYRIYRSKASSDSIKKRRIANGEDVNKRELAKWFKERGKEMTGRCANCGGKTCKGDPRTEKYCVAHILPKRHFHSVATNPSNFIELCFWGESCHSNMDNGVLEMDKMKCWPEIVRRFKILYPLVAESEKQFIPEVLLKVVEL